MRDGLQACSRSRRTYLGLILANVRTNLVFRNAVCQAPSPAFDIDGFADRLDLGAAIQQIRVPQFSLSEWREARLQNLPDRLQLGFLDAASGERVEQILSDFVDQAAELTPNAPLVFNAALRLAVEADDDDPSLPFFNAAELAGRLEGSEGRGGITLVYKDQNSRWWIELSPAPDEDGEWMYDFNRRFLAFPTVQQEREQVFDWFRNIERNLLADFEALTADGGAS